MTVTRIGYFLALILLLTIIASATEMCEIPNPATGGVVTAETCDHGYAVSSYDDCGFPIWQAVFTLPGRERSHEIAAEVDTQGHVLLHLLDPVTRQPAAVAKYNAFGELLWVERHGSDISPETNLIGEETSWQPDPSDPTRLEYQQGWPYEGVMSTMTNSQSLGGANFNLDDPEMELALGTCEDLFVWNHEGLFENGWPINPNFNYRGCSFVEHEGVGKIAFTSWSIPNNMVHIHRQDGSADTNWPIDLGMDASDCPIRKDFDADGTEEVIGAGEQYFGFVWTAQGDNFPGWPIETRRNTTGMAVGDVNNDGVDEIIHASTTLSSKRIRVLDCNGNLLSSWKPVTYHSTGSSNCPSLADLDGDGDLEILLGGYLEIWCWHHDGSEYWHLDVPGGDTGQIAVADLDGDGDLEIVAAVSEYLFAFEADGTRCEGVWPIKVPYGTFVYSSSEHSGPAVADIDGDGVQEIVANAYNNGYWMIGAFEPDGTFVDGFPVRETFDYVPASTPLILDLDGDGDIEICSCAERSAWITYNMLRVVVYDLPAAYNPDLADWPMIQNNPQRTSCYGDFQRSSAAEQKAVLSMTETPETVRAVSASPNPFNPSTVINYQLQTAEFVTLAVYDIGGRKVADLVEARQAAGQHQVTFDAAHLSSGMYFYQLQAGEFQSSGKLLLVK